MAERLTVARPYAEAIFALATEQNALAPWLERLSLLHAVCQDAQMQLLLDDPNIAAEDKINALNTVCGETLREDGKRLVDVLTRAKRLTLLPEIETLYRAAKDAAENTVQATIETALPIGDAQVAALKALLTERTGKKVNATVKVAPELIGGVRMSVGDQIIDASVQGQLASMARELHTP